MAEKLPMLALSPTMEQGIIVKWSKNEGDTINEGDVLCEVETDKAVMEYSTTLEGTLLKIIKPEGDGASVGQTIAIIGDNDEDVSSLIAETKKEGEAASAPAAPTATAAAPPVAAPVATVAPASTGKIKSSPMARKLAKKNNIDITRISGSGPNGRIVVADIESAVKHGIQNIASAPGQTLSGEALQEVIIPVSMQRKVIAERLAESKYSSPHFYLKITTAVDKIIAARQDINKSQGAKISFNAFMMKFVALCLKRHPMINASWMEANIVQHGRIDIGLAVALEDGLITPIVRNCESKGILQIDAELKVLIQKAFDKKLQPEDYLNSTFCISNLGSFGIEDFTAIINPPNAAILAVGKVNRMPVVGDHDEINIQSLMKMTLSCDHRVIDGAQGANFMNDLKNCLEFPVQSLL
jgi:pyruvate dehydrogenase E2 component (dihydrolipoamide acetyltransferase)